MMGRGGKGGRLVVLLSCPQNLTVTKKVGEKKRGGEKAGASLLVLKGGNILYDIVSYEKQKKKKKKKGYNASALAPSFLPPIPSKVG